MPIKDYLKAAEDQLRKADGQTIMLPTPIDASTWLKSEPPAPDQIIKDIFDVKDKLAIIAASKLKKTFFLLQLLLSIATGIPFLSWVIPKPRRVFHIQYEIQKDHYHRRLKKMARAMGIEAPALGDRFQILNARGLDLSGTEGIEIISQIVKSYCPEIISFDPLYKVAAGVENAAEDMKIILSAFDRLAEETDAAIIYIHHDAKGSSGNREIQDRGAGSNVLGRDYDACITLTPHTTEGDAAVVETLLRNYRPQEPFTALWIEDDKTEGYCFKLAPTIIPTKKTSANGRVQNTQALATYLPAALDILKIGPMHIGTFMDLLRTKTGLTYARSTAFKDWATTGLHPELGTISKRGRGQNEKLIGTPEQILRTGKLE